MKLIEAWSGNTLKRALSFVACTLFLSGCGTTTHSYLIKKDLTPDNAVTKAKLEIEIDEQKLLSVSHHRLPGDRAALAASVTTAYQSTPPPQGASPGGMAAAFLMTTYMAKASADSAEISESNKKAQQLFEIVSQDDFKGKLVGLVDRQFLLIKSMQLISDPNDPAVCCDGRVKVLPQLRLSNDLRVLEIKVDYSVENSGSGDLIYSNSFVYQSDPAPSRDDIGHWVKDDASNLFVALETAIEEIVNLIDYEFSHASRSEGQEKVSTIRYKSGLGEFYERGTLLGYTDSRIILRDLRGNVRSINGSILN